MTSIPFMSGNPNWLQTAAKGHNPTRTTVHVNGPWCITFDFRDGDAYVLDFEQYH